MANNENLIKNKDLTPKQRRENASKAGKASAKKRRERKLLKEELLILLSQGDMQEKLSLALINKALSGDVKAFETIRDTIGEKPIDKQEVKADRPIVIEVANEEDKKILEKIQNCIKTDAPVIIDDI